MLYKITPVAKPRMTQRDKWKKRPIVEKYYRFKDAVRESGLQVASELTVTFYLPMPRSWTKKQRQLMHGKPHQQKPDIDNLIKALLDACLAEDSHVWSVTASKFWADEGFIRITKSNKKGLGQ